MKKNILMIALIAFCAMSCQSDDTKISNINTGIFGTIKYGMGDCMPTTGESARAREYTNYNGELYFIVKSDLENEDFEQLKSNSIHATVHHGEMEIELPVGVYLIMPEDVYLYSDYNTITIEPGIVLRENFKFWKCISY